MNPKERIVECLSRFRISDVSGRPADLGRLAEDIITCLGPRRTIYSCVKQDLDIPCEHEDHRMDIIVLAEE